MQQWRGDRGGVMVFFTEHGTVEAAVPCWTTAPYDLTPLERFWYWLRQLLPSEKKGENKEDAAALGRKWKKVTL
jgi:hypothetical protein